MKFKKILAFILSFTLLFSFSYRQKAKAVGPMVACLLVTTGISALGFVWGIIKEGMIVKLNHDEANKLKEEIEKHKGFRSRLEATKLIKDVINGTSPIRIYGQEKAKGQCVSALSGCLENIYGNPSEVRGNVVYMIGDSGVGKTTMAKALANAFLKHSEKTCVFIDSSQVNNEQPLGEQLFKTITKAVNLKKDKNWKNLWGSLDIAENKGGSYDVRVASVILEHIFHYCEVVVIIDEFDKMKLACKPSDASEEYEDRSADEIIKSIAANGKYIVGSNTVDCKKVLLFVTTNETKEQLYKNFGYKGSTGGGVQRLNVIEFDSLDKDCCKRIIDDMVKNIQKNLTNSQGDYKIRHIKFSEETLKNMADYILNDKIKQARAKFDLEQSIYALFSFELEKNINKSFEIHYTPSEKEGEIGIFSKSKIEATGTSDESKLNDQMLLDFSKDSTETVLKDYAPKPQVLKDYSTE